MRNNQRLHARKSTGLRPPVPVPGLGRTRIEIRWLETETQTMDCRRVAIGKAVPVQEAEVHLFLAYPVEIWEQSQWSGRERVQMG